MSPDWIHEIAVNADVDDDQVIHTLLRLVIAILAFAAALGIALRP